MQRPSGRTPDQLRPIRITRRYTKHAEGSVLVEFGDTKVICTASVVKLSSAFFTRPRARLAHRRVRHVAALHWYPYGSRSRAR